MGDPSPKRNTVARPLPSVLTKVRLLNRLPTLDLGSGDYSSCPFCDLGNSRQFGKQDRRFLKIGGVEPFGEPAIERCQQFACLLSTALLPPQPRQIRRG